MDFAEWRRLAGTDLLPGRNPNEASRRDGANFDKSDPLYDLLFVEFDDQGRPFVPTAVDDAMAHLEAVAAGADPIIVVFVHGWKHSARDSDDNVRSFRRLLHAHAHAEFLVPRQEGCRRRVVGLYVGWRGLTWHWLNVVQNLTFWGRKEGALRVALDSVRELFARLRNYRLSEARPEGSGPRLVIAGHRVETEVDADGLLLAGWSRTYSSGAVLRQVQPKPEPHEAGIAPNCPFWVVRAKKEVVDGHNGIFRTVFLDFLRQVLDDVVRTPTAIPQEHL
jgi:hypothetical protein